MALATPQPPPMAYHPRAERLNPLTFAIIGDKSESSRAQSPSGPASSPHHQGTGTNSNPGGHSPESLWAQRTTSSGKSSFSSASSSPTSAASLSYSPAVQSALRDSCRSSTSSIHFATASPQALKNKGQRDLEKQQVPARSTRAASSNRTMSAHHHESSCGLPDGDDDEREAELKAEDKAFRILLYLSGPNCLVSIGMAFYTIFALLATIVLQPVRLCTSGLPFGQSLLHFLSPTLKLQLDFICSICDSESNSILTLLVVNLLSPILALGVMGAAWISAAFWFFNAILGDPDGSDKPKGYNDGRASVMGVRRWWEKWLRRPLR